MILEFKGPIWHWKGPAPHHFVTVPPDESEDIKSVQRMVTYGWGMIPVKVRINKTEWTTALWPKDGQFIVPIKLIARKAEKLELGDVVSIRLDIALELP